MFPEYIIRWGDETVIEKYKITDKKEIEWIKGCKNDMLFIDLINSIIDTRGLKVPIYVSPQAARVHLYFPGYDEYSSPSIGHVPDYVAILDIFRFFKRKFNISYRFTEDGMLFYYDYEMERENELKYGFKMERPNLDHFKDDEDDPFGME